MTRNGQQQANELTLASQLRDPRLVDAVLGTVPDAMVVIDEAGRIRGFSRKAEELFGYALPEVFGENVNLLMPSPYRERHDQYLENYKMTGTKHVIGIGRAVTARRRDGTSFPAHLSVGEFEIDGRRHFVGFLHDLSIRHEIEQRLGAAQAELSHMARVSLASALANAIAHELSQPLAVVSTYLGTIRAMIGDDGDSKVVEAIVECEDEIQRANALLRYWRDFIRPGDGHRESIDVARLIDQALALALADGDGQGVSVRTQLDPNVRRIYGCEIELYQVVVNLLRNALAATRGKATRCIDIVVKPLGGQIEFTIADNGTGVSKQILPRLFQPFASGKGDGLGLGLPICKMIVEGHGGRIWADPSPLGGAAFHFTVPGNEGKIEP